MEQTNHTDHLPNTEAIAAPQPARPDIFVNRELSWLEFNHRVLSESLNPNIPLMERLKFLSIYFSNLDEFFMVRVGSLHDQSILEPDKLDDKTGLNAAGQIAAIRRKVEAINPIAERAWSSLRQLLSTQDIEVLDIHHMSKIDEQIVQNYFNNEIRPLLSPQLIDRQHPFGHGRQHAPVPGPDIAHRPPGRPQFRFQNIFFVGAPRRHGLFGFQASVGAAQPSPTQCPQRQQKRRASPGEAEKRRGDLAFGPGDHTRSGGFLAGGMEQRVAQRQADRAPPQPQAQTKGRHQYAPSFYALPHCRSRAA